jgi:cobalt/nickel transport system permease protein
MSVIDSGYFDLRRLDTLAMGDSWVHRLDPRAKLITTLLFILAVVSFDKYTLTGLLPFVLYPVVLMAAGGLPADYLLHKLLIVAPFAVLIGLFNPLIDRSVHLYIGNIPVTGGWISFLSLMLRFVLTVGGALVLIGVTSFQGICRALSQLRVPSVLIMQLLFLYRYLFVLMEEAVRMSRARTLRTFTSAGPGIRIYSSLLGHLLLRTLNRAERIHLAMNCRGFDGHMVLDRPAGFGRREIFFILSWSLLFLILRCYNIPLFIGRVLTGIPS